MFSPIDHLSNPALFESVRLRVKKLDAQMNYKAKPLLLTELERLDTFFHNANRMRRFAEVIDFEQSRG